MIKDPKSDDSAGLTQWIAQYVGCRPDQLSLDLVAGDASPRRYYRVTLANETFKFGCAPESEEVNTCIAMVSPPSENNDEFVYVGRQLALAGVRTPAVWAESHKREWFLIEDFGDRQLLSSLLSAPSSATALYRQAFDALLCQVSLPCEQVALPMYDAQRLLTELEVFLDWFLDGLLDSQLSNSIKKCFTDLSGYLIASAAEQPAVWVHRDFHSRNLMVLEDSDLGVIDFQDAVVGPLTYDPVSLLKDCYVRWPRHMQLQWLDEYFEKLRGLNEGQLSQSTRVKHRLVFTEADSGVASDKKVQIPRQGTASEEPLDLDFLQARQRRRVANQLADVTPEQFRRWFDLMGLQRHLKVLGVFARLHLRDHKSSYLADLPLVTEYIRESLFLTADSDPSVAEFRDWFESDLMPLILKQLWYKPIDPEGWVR